MFILSCGGSGGGDSSPSTPPPKPENVIAAGGNAQVMLSWGSTDESTTYNIYWSTTAGVLKKTGTKIASVTSPYYHSGLNNGATYFYVVTGANQYGESSESLEVSATPSQIAAPLPPKEVVVFGFNKTAIIRWIAADPGDGNTSHNIYWLTLAGVKKGIGTKIADAVSPYTHDGLNNGTTYYYVVTSANPYGESLESKEVSTTPEQGNVPSAPTGVKVVAGDREAVISWDMIEGDATPAPHTTNNIYWSTSADVSSASGTKIAKVKSPYTHTGLAQGTTYYYVVTSENGFGESDGSQKVSVTIPDSRKDVCVAMGDSITVGYGVDNYADTYVPRLSSRWGKTIYNNGAIGALSSYGASTINAVLAQYNPRYITIYYGTNDSGFYDIDWIIGNLRYIIRSAKANGTIPVVATLGPFFGEWAWKKTEVIDLNQRIRQLAAEEGVPCADIEAALNWNSAYIIKEGMHPNSEGHRRIANAFYDALTD